MNKSFALAAVLLLAACAHTYEPPTVTYKGNQQSLTASKEKILTAAKKVLITEGYQIASIDNEAGTISTALRTVKVKPEQANCGTTMGLDYLKDHRTVTRLGLGIIADDNSLAINANVEAEYRPHSAQQDITLTCVSRGVIEQALQDKIQAALN